MSDTPEVTLRDRIGYAADCAVFAYSLSVAIGHPNRWSISWTVFVGLVYLVVELRRFGYVR